MCHAVQLADLLRSAAGTMIVQHSPHVKSTRPAHMPALSRVSSISTSWMEGPIVAMILVPAMTVQYRIFPWL
jgi:hypothetical protein